MQLGHSGEGREKKAILSDLLDERRKSSGNVIVWNSLRKAETVLPPLPELGFTPANASITNSMFFEVTAGWKRYLSRMAASKTDTPVSAAGKP